MTRTIYAYHVDVPTPPTHHTVGPDASPLPLGTSIHSISFEAVEEVEERLAEAVWTHHASEDVDHIEWKLRVFHLESDDISPRNRVEGEAWVYTEGETS